MPWSCRPEPVEFAATSRQFFLNECDLDATPEAVFGVLADIDSWPRWFDDMRASRWNGAQTGGVGASRHMTMGALSVDEGFVAWEPGRRFSFRLDTITLPLVRAFVEDWQLAPEGAGRTHLRWRIGYETTWLGTLLHPLLRVIFTRQFGRTLAGLQAYLKRGA